MDEREEVIDEEIITDDSELSGEMVEMQLDDEDVIVGDMDEVHKDGTELGQIIPQEEGYRCVFRRPTRSLAYSSSSSSVSHSSRRQQRSLFQSPTMQHQSNSSQMNARNPGQHHPSVYTIRGNQVYRVVRSVPTSPMASIQRSSAGNQAVISKKAEKIWESSPKVSQSQQKSHPVPSSSSPAYRANEASHQHNRMFTPLLSAKLAPKKRPAGGRKPCHCTRSMCLKLYCECFANGEFCKDCDCRDCRNSMDFEVERTQAIKSSLERNPNAFKPKIGVSAKGQIDVERTHQKGCHCRKSYCLKNYCECFEAKVACTNRCKCICCKNTEMDRSARFPSNKQLTALTELRHPISNSDAKNASLCSDDDSEDEMIEPSDPKNLPWFYMTDEVVEAATLCLVAQAEEMESSGKHSTQSIEKSILKEFGRSIGQMIESAARNT